jgi:hypothetical protein
VNVAVTICGQPGHYISDYPKPKQNKPNQQNQGSGTKAINPAKKPMVQLRQGNLNFTTMSDIPEGVQCLRVHSLSLKLLLRYYSILELPIALLVGVW